MRKIYISILFFSLITMSSALNAQVHKLKATFITGIIRYMQWPQTSGGDFIIGVLDVNHPITTELNGMAGGRKVGLSQIKVVEFESIQSLTSCNILFIPKKNTSLSKKCLDKLVNSHVIIITEEQDWVPREATINFKSVENKLAFNLNTSNAAAQKVQISEKLKQMASN